MKNIPHTYSLAAISAMLIFWASSICSSVIDSENAMIITFKSVGGIFWIATAIITLTLKKDFRDKTMRGTYRIAYDYIYACLILNFLLMATIAYANISFFGIYGHMIYWAGFFALASLYAWRLQRAAAYPPATYPR